MSEPFSAAMADAINKTADDMYALGKSDAAEELAATIASLLNGDSVAEVMQHLDGGSKLASAALSNTGKK